MEIWLLLILIFGILFILFLLFSLPRKKNERKRSFEGLDSPEVAKAFEKQANLLPFKLLRRRIISELKKNSPNGRLLDVGCGSGQLVAQIAKKFKNIDILGIDISDEILDLTKIRIANLQLSKNVEFKKATVENLPFAENSIDFIVSSFSLHHWTDPEKVFKELYRILKQEGVLLIFDFRRDSRRFYYGLFAFVTNIVVPKALKKIKEPSGSLNAGYTAREMKEILSKAKIGNVEVKPFLAWMFIHIKKK